MIRKETMTRRVHLATCISFLMAIAVARGGAQTNETSQAAAPTTSPAPSHRLLTEDPEYLKFLKPPSGNDFLQMYSKGYREKSAEIENRIADITDENLRSQARNTEWARVLKKERDRFRNEAEVAFNDAKIAYSQEHPDSWFEIGHVSYDEMNSSLAVQAIPTAPIDANFRILMNGATIKQIYEKFHTIVGQEADGRARAYVAKAGVDSTCGKNPDLCYKFSRDDIERNLRSERIIVAGHGDLEGRKIDRLQLVDSNTGAVLLELDPHVPALSTAAWRFSIGVLPTMETDSDSAEPQTQPAIVPSMDSGSPPSSADTPPARISVPSTLTAAAMITHTSPEYPPKARESHIQGDVVLHAIIDKEGRISELQVLAGDDSLAQAALDAVRQWRYKPMLVDGQPAEVDTTITITFSLVE
jgi:TonB family protein